MGRGYLNCTGCLHEKALPNFSRCESCIGDKPVPIISLPPACGCPTTAGQRQVGGDHYKSKVIQPWDVIDTWPLEQRIGYYRGNLLKYTMRMSDKDAPVDNIGKAEHYAQKLLEILAEIEKVRNDEQLDDLRNDLSGITTFHIGKEQPQ